MGESAYVESITVRDMFIYPVKSARGIAVDEARVTDRGFEHDRRFMIVDAKGRFLTQREHASLALLEVQIRSDGLGLVAPGKGEVEVALRPRSGPTRPVTVWESTCEGVSLGPQAKELLSAYLGIQCDLVYMPDESVRLVGADHGPEGERVGFADAFPFLLLSEASIDGLSARFRAPVPTNRFRPNLVVSGASPHEEDEWSAFAIGDVAFRAAKKCGRCSIVTIDQETGDAAAELMTTLSSYRVHDKKVRFGQYLSHQGVGTIRRGDVLSFPE